MTLLSADESKTTLKSMKNCEAKSDTLLDQYIITCIIASLITQTIMMKNIWKSNLFR